MGFRGTEYPKIITASGTTIALLYAKYAKEASEHFVASSESNISDDGDRVHWNKGRHLEIELIDYMFKYDHPDLHLSDLYNAYGTNVYYYIHHDANACKDSDGNDVPFFFWSIDHIRIGDPYNFVDALRLVLKSTVPVWTVGT